MLNASFLNIPILQDQDIVDVKCPLPIEENVSISDLKRTSGNHDTRFFPTTAMFNRQSNFQRFDLESLFFSFYYLQDTYQ